MKPVRFQRECHGTRPLTAHFSLLDWSAPYIEQLDGDQMFVAELKRPSSSMLQLGSNSQEM